MKIAPFLLLLTLFACSSKNPVIYVSHKYEYEVIASILNSKFGNTEKAGDNYLHIVGFEKNLNKQNYSNDISPLLRGHDFSTDYNISLGGLVDLPNWVRNDYIYLQSEENGNTFTNAEYHNLFVNIAEERLQSIRAAFSDNQIDSQFERLNEELVSNPGLISTILTLEKLFGFSFDTYELNPTFLIPAYFGFGSTLQRNNELIALYIYGPQAVPFVYSTDIFLFNHGFHNYERIINLAVHEFCHSFYRVGITDECVEVIESINHVYTSQNRLQMNSIGYDTWITVFEETFVRSIELIVMELMDEPEYKYEKRLQDEIDRGFIFIESFKAIISSHLQNGKLSMNLEEIISEIVKVIGNAAEEKI